MLSVFPQSMYNSNPRSKWYVTAAAVSIQLYLYIRVKSLIHIVGYVFCMLHFRIRCTYTVIHTIICTLYSCGVSDNADGVDQTMLKLYQHLAATTTQQLHIRRNVLTNPTTTYYLNIIKHSVALKQCLNINNTLPTITTTTLVT